MQNHSVIKSFTNDRSGALQIEGEMAGQALRIARIPPQRQES